MALLLLLFYCHAIAIAATSLCSIQLCSCWWAFAHLTKSIGIGTQWNAHKSLCSITIYMMKRPPQIVYALLGSADLDARIQTHKQPLHWIWIAGISGEDYTRYTTVDTCNLMDSLWIKSQKRKLKPKTISYWFRANEFIFSQLMTTITVRHKTSIIVIIWFGDDVTDITTYYRSRDDANWPRQNNTFMFITTLVWPVLCCVGYIDVLTILSLE